MRDISTSVNIGDQETEADSWWSGSHGTCVCGAAISLAVGDPVAVRLDDKGQNIAYKCEARRCGHTTWIYEKEVEKRRIADAVAKAALPTSGIEAELRAEVSE